MFINAQEEKAVSLFFRKEKRERYKSLLKKHDRNEICNFLSKDNFLDEERITILPYTEEAFLFEKEDLHQQVFVISESLKFDNKWYSLTEALEEICGRGMVSLIILCQENKAIYENEDSTFILYKK
ncbi:hypothetical protein CH371_01560 [Leptospira wolffii]|uniref:Uncharacterized protein n=1 Tax=Leptospira wolffii TaxID=409998 RepID=A0A2M9ZEG6_9LEPT|nr:hypothetical protein [Leptospira wolffii]PJZ66815.1 hypothetical protein CH371_01560 [Leptospira wolffii]